VLEGLTGKETVRLACLGKHKDPRKTTRCRAPGAKKSKSC
jgi:hypothetical protein